MGNLWKKRRLTGSRLQAHVLATLHEFCMIESDIIETTDCYFDGLSIIIIQKKDEMDV